MKLSKDGWAGLAVAAASLFLFALTLGLKQNALVPIGPGFYPRLILGLTAFFALALVAWDLARPRRDAPAAGPTAYRAVVVHFALFAAYAAVLPWIGFRLATFVYVAVAAAAMAPPRRPREWLPPLALGFGTALVTYFVFERYLSVLLPRGRWTDF